MNLAQNMKHNISTITVHLTHLTVCVQSVLRVRFFFPANVFKVSHNEFLSAKRYIFNTGLCTNLHRPTAPNWCNTLECMHMHPQAFITALVKVETSPAIHLSAYWHQRTCFYALPRDLWATKAERARVRAWMHTLSAYAHLVVWKGSGWCAYWHLASL